MTSEALHLESCPACGRDISPHARSCPQCGHPGPAVRVDPRRRVIRGRALLIAGVVVLAASLYPLGTTQYRGLAPLALGLDFIAMVVLVAAFRRDRVAILGGRVVTWFAILILVFALLGS